MPREDQSPSAEDIDTTARTIYGEARGEPFLGQVGVAWVVKNRMNALSWYGRTPAEVCRKPKQFSCWNDEDANREKILGATLDQPGFAQALGIACLVLTGNHLADPTHGATHYHAAWVRPAWAQFGEPTVQLGQHQFYRGIP